MTTLRSPLPGPTPRGQRLRELLQGSPYVSYLYSYPHKTAHRRLEPPVPLQPLWSGERRDGLFLYIHVPFCAVRCGYCNLFSNKRRPAPEQVGRFIDTLERQARVTRDALGSARFARFAMGGGTPTTLGLDQLARCLDVAQRIMGADLEAIPSCVEVSPETASADRLQLLRRRGIDRISVGVQSFHEGELRALRRQQSPATVHAVLDRVQELGFPTLNVDLIYGIEGQDERCLEASLDQTLRHQPREVFLYPLYVRPLTQLGAHPAAARECWNAQRLALYRTGRRRLLAAGYRQHSMRMFRREETDRDASPGTRYSCQDDGMVGLACGARSYTERLHYSTEWAVSPGAVEELIEAYIARSDRSFSEAQHGIHLDEEDRRRRHVLLSLLQAEGMDLGQYRQRFGGEAWDQLPELRELQALELARLDGERLRLTEAGLERSDMIGPWLHSARVQQLIDSYHLR